MPIRSNTTQVLKDWTNKEQHIPCVKTAQSYGASGINGIAHTKSKFSAFISLSWGLKKKDDDDDHVDGVILRLWTAATNRPSVHSSGDIWT
jgi:hypothetical protein